jgi:hypothetical protein
MAIFLSVCWGRGRGEGDSLQVSPFYYFYSPPIYLDPVFWFFFRGAKFRQNVKKNFKFCHNCLIFCWKKIVNFGEKKDSEKNSAHLDFDLDFIFGDLHFLN